MLFVVRTITQLKLLTYFYTQEVFSQIVERYSLQ